MPDSAPLISAIVVSYNTRSMTIRCLQALKETIGAAPFETWVVDNASTDGTPDAVRESFPDAHLIENRHNVGFAAANNQAMARARGRYLLLINSDAFVRPGAVASLVDYLEQHPKVGLVGPRLLNADESLQRSCWRFPSPARSWLDALWITGLLPANGAMGDYRNWSHDSDRRVDFVIGACMLVRLETCRQVGGFDERFRMYGEEMDWQRRITDGGWSVGFTAAADVVHIGGGSSGADKIGARRDFFESQDYYCVKHYGTPGLIAKRLAVATGSLVRAPLWAAVFLLRPKRRTLARQKIRLCAWLARRELTTWHRVAAGNRPA